MNSPEQPCWTYLKFFQTQYHILQYIAEVISKRVFLLNNNHWDGMTDSKMVKQWATQLQKYFD
jgi:hypothetical protein